MQAAKESLVIKRKVLERFTEKNLYPYSKFYLREIKPDRDFTGKTISPPSASWA
jgi:ribonucleoside-triphosphate reductase (formate)